jgi:hypothetical protein
MATPTLMETLIHDNIHAYSPHQCFYLSPFEINGKGYLPLGMLPLTELSLWMLTLSKFLLSFSLPFTRINFPYQSDIAPALTNNG